jgi:hypothetical protein
MGPDETANQVQLSGTKAMAAGKLKWFEPKRGIQKRRSRRKPITP